MKALQCEMCGSQDLVKNEGVFVCQSCGTKYSVEEAKKMMVEGTVDVKGTVKVDKSNEVEKLLKLAKTSVESLNGEEGYNYANRVLEIDPENSQAWYLRMKAVGQTAILKDLKVLEVVKAGTNAIKYSNNELSKDVYTYFLIKCLNDLKFLMKHISDTDAIKRLYEANIRVNAFKATEKTLAADKISNIIMEQASLVLHLRKIVPNKLVSENPDISKIVGEVAKQWVYYTNALNARFNVMGTKLNDATVEKYRKILAEIKQGLPEDAQDVISNEEISNPSSGPCYVATAVYGSYDCPQVWTLRRFRDYTLAESWLGSLFIKIYYSISPTLVHWFGNTSWFKTIWRSLLDKLVNTLNERGVENTPYQDRKF